MVTAGFLFNGTEKWSAEEEGERSELAIGVELRRQ